MAGSVSSAPVLAKVKYLTVLNVLDKKINCHSLVFLTSAVSHIKLRQYSRATLVDIKDDIIFYLQCTGL